MSDNVEILRNSLPDPFRGLVQPETDLKRRLLVASATLPMPPDTLFRVLLALIHDPDEAVSQAAARSLDEMPRDMVDAHLRTSTDTAALGLALEHFHAVGQDAYVVQALTNQATPDQSIATVAGGVHARLADIISDNVVRLIRCPDIIKALYFNIQTPMPIIRKMIETAVRNHVDLSALPGADAIVRSIMGTSEQAAAMPQQMPGPEGASEAQAGPAPSASPAPAAGPDFQGAPGEPLPDGQVSDALGLEFLLLTGEGGADAAAALDDAEFLRLLAEVAVEDTSLTAASARQGPETPQDEDSRDLYSFIRKLGVAEKIRMALIGNLSARKILIKDTRKLVACAVLDSPRLTDKEILDFARNKTLSDDVVRKIAFNREWTRGLPVQKALVTNPKCPPQKALEFIKNLTPRDLKDVAMDRDIPVYLTRQAKTLLARREARKS
jgi:hypothetical protein